MEGLRMNDESLYRLAANIGDGLDMPVLEKGNLCLFSLHTGKWAIYRKKSGLVKAFETAPTEEYLQSLRDDGWTDIHYG